MIKAKQHIPSWAFDSRDPPSPSAEVATVDELLEVKWIRSWRKHPKFYRYSVSRSIPTRPHLMVELDDGREWWVLAYLNDAPALSSLPEWKARFD
jgi:hypothetical protein